MVSLLLGIFEKNFCLEPFTIPVYAPLSWKDYELIDSGFGQKLERFGSHTLIRPEPQAIWKPGLPQSIWTEKATARFDREQKEHYRSTDEISGGWKRNKSMPESWQVDYTYSDRFSMKLRLALTGFGHVGVFPEQGSNWNFMWDALTKWKSKNSGVPRVLNLFAYTGAASVVCRMAGAEVTHVDASRPGLNWASQNMQLNQLDNIRWVYEDALKFVRREARRGNRYHAIIMDPPPYGRGPEGEKWTLHEKLDELVGQAHQLMAPDPAFFVMSLYAVGLSSLAGLNVVKSYFNSGRIESGEFFLNSTAGQGLPMGTFLRIDTL
jgi:23S rRNA (cytosine1962-C5)-methyltransferase